MAQGKLKLKAKAPARVTKKQISTKAAAPRICKPKKGGALHSQKLAKVHSAQLQNSTEKLISSRVGHLELLKGTRRQLEKSKKKDVKK
jgi:hypothetical protein